MHYFRYLDIQIASTLENQYNLNMGRVIQELKRFKLFWNKLPLSVMGRVALNKMVLLPRCLYTLENLCCRIPKHTSAELNSLLISLVWA